MVVLHRNVTTLETGLLVFFFLLLRGNFFFFVFKV